MTFDEQVNILERYWKDDISLYIYKTSMALFPKLKGLKGLISHIVNASVSFHFHASVS